MKVRNDLNSPSFIYLILAISVGKTINAEVIEGLFGLFIGGFFYSAAWFGTRNNLKNILGKYKYTM
jgi:hypothetical protein